MPVQGVLVPLALHVSLASLFHLHRLSVHLNRGRSRPQLLLKLLLPLNGLQRKEELVGGEDHHDDSKHGEAAEQAPKG